ncbi:MAG: SDR family NAD(P)-dependent oxidoreductase [Caldisericia bacterium]|nr:SDR family NAD(P)-dependent oxidoreductase [Caldisericia bacterium]MDD5689090.1 SDR family NAD(P)-dependent oxidoreductase [Caldisericia bacterium]
MNNITYNFKDKVVIVTGAGQGIGKETSNQFAKAGANIVLVDINQEKLEEVKSELDNNYNTKNIIVKTDVKNNQQVSKMVKYVMKEFGRIDILFNNAGVTRRSLIKDANVDDFRYIMSINLEGAFVVAHTVGKEMIKRRKGKIINVASMSAFEIQRGRQNGIYCISKAGVVMLTKAMGAEWAEYNINVNAIAPGYTKTPINLNMIENPDESIKFTRAVPLGRFAEAEEIAYAALFLASEEASYIVGETIIIDGGATTWLNS